MEFNEATLAFMERVALKNRLSSVTLSMLDASLIDGVFCKPTYCAHVRHANPNSYNMKTPMKNLLTLALLFAIPFGFVACDDDDVMEPAAPTTIASVASSDDRFDSLVDALTSAGLVDALSNPTSSLTVFAPTDDAFAEADLSPFTAAQVSDVLLYHVYNFTTGKLTSGNITDGTSFIYSGNTLGPNESDVVAVVNKNTDGVSINNAKVIDADIDTDNGVIHAIDKVLLPPTVVDIAVAFPGTSSLVSALGAADASPDYDLVNTLSGTGPFTVFAPTNDVFMVDASATADQIGAILAYHVIPGNVRAEDLPDGMMQSVTTVNGAALNVIRNGDAVTLTDGQGNTFNVTTANVQGANGVIHTIDGVMMP